MITWILTRTYVWRNEILHILFAITCIGLPLIIPSIRNSRFRLFARWYDRARRLWRRPWEILRSHKLPPKIPPEILYDTYPTPQEESKYWESAILGQRQLSVSHAHHASMGSIPVIASYKPALLPRYRTERRDVGVYRMNIGAEYYLSARTFCKWHRMVFPGPVHPTIQQASKLRMHFSNRDLREMFRISRLISDEAVFARTYHWTPQYRDMWRKWLEEKGPDLAIIFA